MAVRGDFSAVINTQADPFMDRLKTSALRQNVTFWSTSFRRDMKANTNPRAIRGLFFSSLVEFRLKSALIYFHSLCVRHSPMLPTVSYYAKQFLNFLLCFPLHALDEWRNMLQTFFFLSCHIQLVSISTFSSRRFGLSVDDAKKPFSILIIARKNCQKKQIVEF